jgi:osmotically-inducible protein OsmY
MEWNFQREKAEDLARSVAGIREVANSIQVEPSVSPTEVKTKIEDALRRSAAVDARRVVVTAHEGTVHL